MYLYSTLDGLSLRQNHFLSGTPRSQQPSTQEPPILEYAPDPVVLSALF